MQLANTGQPIKLFKWKKLLLAAFGTFFLVFLVASTVYLYPLLNLWLKTYIAFLNPTEVNQLNYRNALQDEAFVGRDFPKSFIPTLSVFDKSEKILEQNLKESANVSELPQGVTIIQKGKLGEYITSSSVSRVAGIEKEAIKNRYFIKAENQKELLGIKGKEEVEALIKENFGKLVNALRENQTLTYFPTEFSVSDKSLLNGLSVQSINTHSDYKIISDENKVVIGQVKIFMENCSGSNVLNLVFNIKEKTLEFGGINLFINALCKERFTEVNGVVTGTCTDCTWFPVNKTFALRPDYETELVYLDTIPGGQFFSKAGYSDLLDLNSALQNSGFSLAINSGYRSYYTQAYLFEYYVSIEMANGATRAQAELIANSYSARPGHSEHQLGTAVDIANSVCGDFTANCEGNTSLYNWMLENAQNYGFVLSYPHDRVAETGYVYEPWHWRWIGKEMAQEFWNLRGDMSVNTFLYNKGRY